MGEKYIYEIGKDKIKIGDYVYRKDNLGDVPTNVVGLQRYNRKTNEYETYNPHKTRIK